MTIVSKDLNDTFNNLGFYMNKGDCNDDGYPDLLIGSPFSKGTGGVQRGKIHLIQGVKRNLRNQSEVFIEDIADLELQAEVDYQWFGYSAICFGNQLVVGSPGARMNKSIQASGKVFGFDLVKNENGSLSSSLSWSIQAKDPQAKFGLSLAFNPLCNILAIGSSSFATENEYIHAGRVLLYNITEVLNSKLILADNFRSAISASASYARFGYQVAWNQNDLIVSSPQYGDILGLKREKGAVFVYKNAANLVSELDYENYDMSFYGLSGGGRFGSKIVVDHDNSTLLVSSPWSWNVEKRLSGGLHFIDLEEVRKEDY